MAKIQFISSIVFIAICATCTLVEAKSGRSGRSGRGKASRSSVGPPLFVKKKTCEKKCHGVKICQRVEDLFPFKWHCRTADCGPLSSPASGSVATPRGTTMDMDAEYTCITGYLLTGNPIRTCQADGQWSGTEPSCNRIVCGNLSNPANGNVDTSAGLEFENEAIYQCDPRYVLTGPFSRWCQSDSSWTGTEPVCTPIVCGELCDPINGQVNTSAGVSFGNEATYECDSGYVLTDQSSRWCLSDGNWNGTEPFCNPVVCGALSNPDNGEVDTSNGLTFGSVAIYQCNLGYTLTGQASRACEYDGNWNGTEPVCMAIVCVNLSNPANGNVETSAGLEFENEAIYQCDPGYVLTGPFSRWCQSDSSWTGTEPVCTPIVCGALCDPVNGQVNTSAGVSFGNEATYDCDSGYVLTDQSSRWCLSDGNWNGTEPFCNPVVCGVLSNPDNGEVDTSNGLTFGSVAIYQCNLGYTLTGQASRACENDGNWNGTEPVCMAIVCGNLSDPENGQVTSSAGLQFENEATYQCDPGYVLTGPSSRWCQSDGTWTDTDPICCPIDCGPLEDPCDGRVSTPNGTVLDQTAVYECQIEFVLVGDAERVCLPTGQWSHNKPCCIVGCGSPSAPANGQVSTPDGTLLGTQAVYECDGEAHMVGDSTRTCQWNGIWSGMAPQCKTCPEPFEYFFDETVTCYFAGNGTNSDGFTWSEARQLCLNINGKLAEVTTAPEHNFLVGVLNTIGAGSSTDYWIGGRERKKDNYWVWDSSSTNIKRFFWAKGYPKCKTSKRCLKMCDGCSSKIYSWINANCDSMNQYICETPAL